MIQFIAALSLAVAPVLQAQENSTSLPDITVSGVRGTVQEAERFVDEVATAPTHALSLPVWMTPICVATVNLRPEAAAGVNAQIEMHARELGVRVLPAGCSPNITVLATSDGRFTATDLVAAHHDRFIASPGPTQGDERALRRFAESEVPVRWWTISALMDEDSHRILVPIWGMEAAPIDTSGEGYWGQNRREAMLTTLVIVDVSKTRDISDAALGDYVSMVVLSNVDPLVRPAGYPSILNLWDGGTSAAGLTAWDRAYLKGLYQAQLRLTGSQLQVRSLYQRNEIARIMARELATGEVSP